MTRPVATIAETATVYDAAKLLAEKNIGGLVIMEDEKPRAIVTERDFVLKVLAKGLDYKDVKIKDIMTASLVCVEMDTPLLDISRSMSKGRFRHIVVLRNGRVMGIITATDLVHIFAA